LKSDSPTAWRKLFISFFASVASATIVYLYLFILGVIAFWPRDLQHDNAAGLQFTAFLFVALLGPVLILVPVWICLFLILKVMRGKPHPLLLTGVGLAVGLLVGLVPLLLIGGVVSMADVWFGLVVASPVALFGGVAGLVGGLLRRLSVA
jgi:hypothetical protein